MFNGNLYDYEWKKIVKIELEDGAILIGRTEDVDDKDETATEDYEIDFNCIQVVKAVGVNNFMVHGDYSFPQYYIKNITILED